MLHAPAWDKTFILLPVKLSSLFLTVRSSAQWTSAAQSDQFSMATGTGNPRFNVFSDAQLKKIEKAFIQEFHLFGGVLQINVNPLLLQGANSSSGNNMVHANPGAGCLTLL